MRNTGIEWTDDTWNPIRGCSRVSAGCMNCYAEDMAARFSGPGLPYEGLTTGGKWNGTVRMIEEHLTDPLRWQRPRRVFVNSMSDLFHESLSFSDIARVFAVMQLAQRHTFQVLTKRPERMADWFEWLMSDEGRGVWLKHVVSTPDGEHEGWSVAWPFRNIELGTTTENQATFDARVPHLLRVPARVRFLSMEPLIGPIDASAFLSPGCEECPAGDPDCEAPDDGEWHCHDACEPPGLHWFIVGGESGPGARPCDVAWVQGIVEQGAAYGVPVFVKQLGAHPTIADVDHMADWPHGVRRSGTGRLVLTHPKGANMAEWPEAIRIREFAR